MILDLYTTAERAGARLNELRDHHAEMVEFRLKLGHAEEAIDELDKETVYDAVTVDVLNGVSMSLFRLHALLTRAEHALADRIDWLENRVHGLNLMVNLT